MVLFNHSTRELTAKIVYYGPGLCGKTTNLKVLHERLEKGTAGRLLSLATAQDRTIYFDLLPVELGNIKGYTVRFQLCTVPGQVFYNETRKLVLRGVDGIVFVVDSQWSMLSHNLESYQNLRENLRDQETPLESLPLVIQYNKRDLPGVLSVDALQESLGFQSQPYVEAIASAGRGVVETFKLVSKLTFVDLLRRLQRVGLPEPEAPTPARDIGEDTDPTTRRRPETFAPATPPRTPPSTPRLSPEDALRQIFSRAERPSPPRTIATAMAAVTPPPAAAPPAPPPPHATSQVPVAGPPTMEVPFEAEPSAWNAAGEVFGETSEALAPAAVEPVAESAFASEAEPFAVAAPALPPPPSDLFSSGSGPALSFTDTPAFTDEPGSTATPFLPPVEATSMADVAAEAPPTDAWLSEAEPPTVEIELPDAPFAEPVPQALESAASPAFAETEETEALASSVDDVLVEFAELPPPEPEATVAPEAPAPPLEEKTSLPEGEPAPPEPVAALPELEALTEIEAAGLEVASAKVEESAPEMASELREEPAPVPEPLDERSRVHTLPGAETVAEIRADLVDRVDGLRAELSALRSELEAHAHVVATSVAAVRDELVSLRADMETRTRTIGEVFEAFQQKLSEEMRGVRDSAHAELQARAADVADGQARLGALDAALSRLHGEASDERRRLDERLSGMEARTQMAEHRIGQVEARAASGEERAAMAAEGVRRLLDSLRQALS